MGVAFGAVALAWLLRPPAAHETGAEAGPATQRAAADAGVARPLVPVPDLPPSLRGTTEDGALVRDASGRFAPTPDAIDLFDYYLAAEGEETLEQIHARILAAIRARLDGPEADAAEALLADYLAYRAQAAELLSGPLVGESFERRLQYLRELRREVFGTEVAAALFGAEQARWFADLEARRIALDATLDEDEKQARLAALEADLPAEVRAVRDQALAPTELRREEARLRTAGASAAEIEHLREARFGREAADRLAELDEERARWASRLAVYREARDRALARASAGDREAILEAVRAEHFESGELLRVRTLDALETSPSP